MTMIQQSLRYLQSHGIGLGTGIALGLYLFLFIGIFIAIFTCFGIFIFGGEGSSLHAYLIGDVDSPSHLSCVALADYPLSGQMFFQDPGSLNLLGIIDLHDRIMFPMFSIIGLVAWVLGSIIINSPRIPYAIYHGNTLELIWTLIPALILWSIGIPSLKLLYLLDSEPQHQEALYIKVIGNQWYWTYEMHDLSFDSYIVPSDDLDLGDLHSLTVDEALPLPILTQLKFIVTSNDVIHSFAVPSLGLKVDAIPGRLNATSCIITRPSIYYGQCSELCGVLHGFMPIVLDAQPVPSFLTALADL